MKMKTPLLLTLSLVGLGGFGAVQAIELELQKDDMWAIDGGVFFPASQPIDSVDMKSDQLIIKHIDGSMRVVNLGSVESSSMTKAARTVAVDRTPPVIKMQWQGVLHHETGVTIGPNSQVVLSVNEGLIKRFKLNQEMIEINADSYSHNFNQSSDKLSVTASDAFNNKSQLDMTLQTDFESPKLTWQLAEPAVFNNQKWYAGKDAQVLLSATDISGVAHFMLNGEKLAANTKQVTMSTGDDIHVTDVLGNTTTDNINWQQDSQTPYIVINTEKGQLERVKFLKVGVNEIFELLTVDEGVGLGVQKYKGKYSRWLNLPKKFKFTSSGTYRIKVQSKDRVGNILEKVIKVKVKK